MARKKSAKAERERLAKQVARQQDRASVAKRKANLDTAKKAKREAMGEARATCKVDREKTKESTRAEYQATVEKARAKRDQKRAGARSRCDLAKRAVVEKHDPAIQKAAKDLLEERKYYKGKREGEAINKDRERERNRSRSRKTDRMKETNEEVAKNLPPELVPVWHAVKGAIKGGPRRSRLEAFEEYIQENPEIVTEVHEKIAAKEMAKLEREAAKAYAEQRPTPKKAGARREEDPDLGDAVAGAFDEVFGFFDALASGADGQQAA